MERVLRGMYSFSQEMTQALELVQWYNTGTGN